MCSTLLWSPPYYGGAASAGAVPNEHEQESDECIQAAKVVKNHISKFRKAKKATTATLQAAFTEFKPHIDVFKVAHKAAKQLVRQNPTFKEGLREYRSMMRSLNIFCKKWPNIRIRRYFNLRLLRNPLIMLKKKFRIRV
jgi:hypothetical protein